jgi:hypothetical protein
MNLPVSARKVFGQKVFELIFSLDFLT